MKASAPWIVALLISSLALSDADARGGGGGGQGGRGGGGARAGAGGGGGRQVQRSPMTGSKMNRPIQQPQARPATRPAARPGGGGGATTRPGAGGGGVQRPGGGANRPGGGGGGALRPGGGGNVKPMPMPIPDRPNTKPGKVNYPKPGNRPGGGGNIIRPGGGNNIVRPGGGNTIVRPGGGNAIINKRPVINRPNFNLNKRPGGKPNWGNNWGKWGNWNRPGRPGGNVNIGNTVNITINNNFRKNVNWGYRPNYWGNRPWWNANLSHGWHHGSWNYGWNRRWYGHYHYYRPRPWPGYVVVDRDNDFAEGVAWGIAAWGLGNLIYNSGYQSYRNPYPAPPVQSGNTTIINYSEPISVSAGRMPPGDEKAEQSAEEKSNAALEVSRGAFKRGDYLAALKSADESLAAMPGDTAIHEYRALILFALGKYGEAAGVLNPVLASGPGWDWTTMTGMYASQSIYTDQLRKLENYSRAKPDDAASHFLLGYHHLVCAHLEQAQEQFEQVVKLQPADSIAAQLRDLCKSSTSPETDDATEDTPPVEKEASPPVAAEQLIGTWVSDRGDQGKVTLKMAEDGNFTWTFSKGDQKNDLAGTFSIDEKGLLVLASEDSQMVGEIKLPDDKKLNFVLAGGPQGDPGLTFNLAP